MVSCYYFYTYKYNVYFAVPLGIKHNTQCVDLLMLHWRLIFAAWAWGCTPPFILPGEPWRPQSTSSASPRGSSGLPPKRPINDLKNTPKSSIVVTLAPQNDPKMDPKWSHFLIRWIFWNLHPRLSESLVFDDLRASFFALFLCFCSYSVSGPFCLCF